MMNRRHELVDIPVTQRGPAKPRRKLNADGQLDTTKTCKSKIDYKIKCLQLESVPKTYDAEFWKSDGVEMGSAITMPKQSHANI